jgi:hypothetical protein
MEKEEPALPSVETEVVEPPVVELPPPPGVQVQDDGGQMQKKVVENGATIGGRTQMPIKREKVLN